MFKAVRKNTFRKNSRAKRGNCFNREYMVLIILQYNIKSGIMAILNIYHLFVTAVVLIRSLRRRRKKNKRRRERRLWIRPLFADRASCGVYPNLAQKVKEIDKNIFGFVRMSPNR